MKYNNKAKLLAIMMFLQATFGWSKEQWAKVVRVLDTPKSDGGTTTQIFFDLYKNAWDGRPDFSMYIHNTNRVLFSMLLKESLPMGAIISYNDERILGDKSNPILDIPGLLSVNDESILDILPGFENIFIYAVRKRAAQQKQGKSR